MLHLEGCSAKIEELGGFFGTPSSGQVDIPMAPSVGPGVEMCLENSVPPKFHWFIIIFPSSSWP